MTTKESKHTPTLTVQIGGAGANINIEDDYNHPLSFTIKYPEFDAKLNKQGQDIARLIEKAPLLPEAIEALTDITLHFQAVDQLLQFDKPDEAKAFSKAFEKGLVLRRDAIIAKYEGGK